MSQPYQNDAVLDSISTTPKSGQLAENTGPNALRSGVTCEVAIKPGLAVCPGTSDVQVKLPTSAAEVAKCFGVSVFMEMKSETSADFSIGEALLYTDVADIWVAVEDAVTRGNQAFVRHTASGGNTQLGKFRSDGDSNTAAALPDCRFMSSTTGSGFAKVRVRLPAV